MTTVILRTLLLYALLIAAMRLTGKRQIGELQLSELVTTLLISEIAANPIVLPSSPLWHAILPILLIVLLELGISFLVTKSPTIKLLFDGRPSVLIRRGSIDQKELGRQRISVDELLSALRLKGFPDPSAVSYAILEQNGQLSVFSDAECSSLAYPLIVDGKEDPAALKAAGKDRNWLKKRLSALSCRQDRVFLFTVTDDGTEFLARREDK